MRLLVDESLPIELADELIGHEATTVHAQDWLQLKNGVLLRSAVRAGFDVIVTADTKLRYQQNLPKLGIAAVVTKRVRNRIEDLRPLVPKILSALSRIRVGEVIEIEP